MSRTISTEESIAFRTILLSAAHMRDLTDEGRTAFSRAVLRSGYDQNFRDAIRAVYEADGEVGVANLVLAQGTRAW